MVVQRRPFVFIFSLRRWLPMICVKEYVQGLQYGRCFNPADIGSKDFSQIYDILFISVNSFDRYIFRLRFKRPTFDQKFLFIFIRFDLISVEEMLNFEKKIGQKKLTSCIVYIY